MKDFLGVCLVHLGVAFYAMSWLTIATWVLYVGADPIWTPGAIAALYIGAVHTLID